MKSLYVQWLILVGGIVGPTLVLSALVLGVSRVLRHIYGYSSPLLLTEPMGDAGLLPRGLLHFGTVCFTCGGLWLHGVRDGRYLTFGLSIAALFSLIRLGLSGHIARMIDKEDLPDGIISKVAGIHGVAPLASGLIIIVMYVLVGIGIGFFGGGLLGLLTGVLTGVPHATALRILKYTLLTGIVLGGLAASVRGIRAGLQVGGKGVLHIFCSSVLIGLGGALMGAILADTAGLVFGAFFSILGSGMACGLGFIGLLVAQWIAGGIAWLIMPSIILSRFSRILCNYCLRYTHPLHSTYKRGQRYCERCRRPVELTDEVGMVVVRFGDVPFVPQGRVFLLSNPDFVHYRKTIEVSLVYLDTLTCDRVLLERFLTYLMNYPPEQGLQQIEVYTQGELDELGPNLKNLLRNTFHCVKQVC